LCAGFQQSRELLMHTGLAHKIGAVISSISLLLMTSIGKAHTGPQTTNPSGSQQEYAPLTPEELDGLVAPIALYPDALVAQILGAATFPDQVTDADGWLSQNSKLNGESLMKAVDQQSWDPAVKALTQFPSVLDNLAKNLVWTSALGEASALQQQDVMAAVQRMRAKAYAAGNLKSGAQIKVIQESPQTIIIQPANPQVVYVPTYNPTVVYGTPVVTPGYSAADMAAVGILSFGVGIAVGSMMHGGCCGWGWGGWGTNWHSSTVIYNRNVYVGNSYWRGGYHGGYRPGYPGYRPGYPANPGYRPGYPAYRPPNSPGARPPYPGYRPPVNSAPRPTPYAAGSSAANRSVPPANRASATPQARPSGATPSTRPSTNELRGYQRSQTPNASTQPARANAFSGSGGGRAQSARGNQSLGASKGGGARRRS
jgi:Protein of unknown function (DUF3300)